MGCGPTGRRRSLPWLAVTVALVVLAAAAVAAAAVGVALALQARSEGSRAGAQAAELAGLLDAAAEARVGAEAARKAAEARAAAAEARGGEAEQRWRAAEKRAGEAERRVAEADRRAAEADRRAEEARRAGEAARAAGGAVVARALWQLERVRAEREWADVVGPGVDLPRVWDGGLVPVVEAELSVIREVMGTPSRLAEDPSGGGSAREGSAEVADLAGAVLRARLAVEVLRRLARTGEEMVVVAGPERMVVEQSGPEGGSGLEDLVSVAGGAGMVLAVDVADGYRRVTLTDGA
jgi:hypothetical protein